MTEEKPFVPPFDYQCPGCNSKVPKGSDAVYVWTARGKMFIGEVWHPKCREEAK